MELDVQIAFFRRLPKGLAVVAIAAFLTGCSDIQDCEDTECAVIHLTAEPETVTQGVAGYCIHVSDPIAAGPYSQICRQCYRFDDRAFFWPIDAPVETNDQASAACSDNSPTDYAECGWDSAGKFEIALDPGWYLMCWAVGFQVCANVRVDAGKVTTVDMGSSIASDPFWMSEPGELPERHTDAFATNCDLDLTGWEPPAE